MRGVKAIKETFSVGKLRNYDAIPSVQWWRVWSTKANQCSPINRQRPEQNFHHFLAKITSLPITSWPITSWPKTIPRLCPIHSSNLQHLQDRDHHPSIHHSTKFLGAESRTLHHHSRDEFITLLLSRWGKLQSVTMTLLTIFVSVLCVWICELCNWRHEIFRIFLLIFLRFSVYYWVNFENSFMMHVTILCPFTCLGNFQS